MRAQDFVGWLVPAYVIAWSGAGLVVTVKAERYSQLWLPIAGLAFGVVLTVGLLRRRKEWLKTRSHHRAAGQRRG